MGACEVTWDEYELFMLKQRAPNRDPGHRVEPALSSVADAVALPTGPYLDMSFGMGRGQYPAISMTHHAASKYCQWLSARTGHFYRLPTEAEWEYACRAGTTTRYSFGDDDRDLDRHAWFDRNSDYKTQRVGRKQPNPWGLHDMHGNVAEWTLDGYDPGAYGRLVDGAGGAYLRGTKPYPHVVRGGSWEDGTARLRSAARRPSEKKWKEQDPDLPKSVWHLTDAQFVGFRIVRPLRLPGVEEAHRAWNNGVERE